VNMSYFIDPWWMNCASNPADASPEQLEQQTIMAATQRAVDYAYAHGVTLIASEGNEHADLGHPTTDTLSPDFPGGTEKSRAVDNSCKVLPTEANHVMSISALGPTERKADYSNYGVEQTTVAAPGGFSRDDPWAATLPAAERARISAANSVWAALPEYVARTTPGLLNPDGSPASVSVARDCAGGTCGYYIAIRGTSMASPHVVGVAALIVSKYGDKRGGGITMDPAAVESILTSTARDHACPEPRLHTYTDKGLSASLNAFCEGDAEFNGFYGHGIVDALAAVSTPRGLGK
jgi:subtilisin family serine protease